jgi:membrane-associated phospholipid phosphatase
MENVKWMSKCFMALSTCSGLIYFLYPTTMVYPLFENSGLNSFVLEQLIKVDTPKNCLPSLHAGLTTIVVWGLIQIKRPIFSLFMILWGIAICYSILQLKRHLFIDLASGFALALIFGTLLKFIHKKNAE